MLNEPKLWHRGADHLGNVGRNEMGIVLLAHSCIGMIGVRRDHGQWCAGQQQVRGIPVAQNVETGRWIDASTATGLTQRPVLDYPIVTYLILSGVLSFILRLLNR
jgi:hypothetical protein